MKGFIIFTDRDREKNCVTDANNFLLPVGTSFEQKKQEKVVKCR